MATEETGTLTESLESTVQAQENAARVSVDGDESVKHDVHTGGDDGVVIESRVVETEISVGKTFVCSHGRDGGFIGDAKGTGSLAAEGVNDVDLALLNGDGSYEEIGLDQNACSVDVEGRGSLGSVNEEGEKSGFLVNKGSLAENEAKPGEEFVKIPGSEGNKKLEDHQNVEGEEDGSDQEHEYSVGDFVWGKIRSHPWWPGRIYDPSDASEYARKYGQEEKLLVAYFGDESFSWCSPSQLKPFAEDFEEMSGQSNSMSFVNAVQNAVDEIGKLVELKITCYCISEESRIGLGRHTVTNAGIKEGVLVPDCDVHKLSLPLNGPTQVLSTLRYIAEVVSITSLLEFTVLRSWLLAFYRAKGVQRLPIYYEPRSIAGLEDKSRNVGVTDMNDFSRAVEVPFGGPVEEDWICSPVHLGLGQTNQSLLQKCPGIAEDKLYERRKKRTVAELIEDDMVVKPDYMNGSSVNNVTTPAKLVQTSGKEKRKICDESVSRDGSDLSSPLGKNRGGGKRSETEGFAISKEKRVRRDKNGEDEEETQKKDSVSTVGNGDKNAKEEIEKGLVSGRKRGRKKKLEIEESTEKKVPSADHGCGKGEAETKEEDGVSSVGNEHTNAKEETKKGLASGGGRGRRNRVETRESSKKKDWTEKDGGGKGDEETKEDSVSGLGNEDPNAKEETGKGVVSVKKRGRGKKAETRGSDKSTEKGVQSVKNGAGEGEEETKEDDSVLSVGNDDNSTKGEIEKGLASRERKKSKYLSPPFTSLTSAVRNSKAEKDYLEVESEKIARVVRIGERMISAAGQLIGSPRAVNNSEETKADTIALSTPNPPREVQMKTIDSLKINASSKEVISELSSAATSPLRFKEKMIVDMLLDFISSFRSAIFLWGPNYKIYHRRQPGRKRKSPSSGPDTEIPESISLRERNEKKEQQIPCVQKLGKDGGELGKKKRKKETIEKEKGSEASTSPMSLIVTFPSGYSLPSKNDVKAMFSKFGALNDAETEVLYNCSCAMVVFVNSSDAEEAFNASLKECPFGTDKVSYRLRYSSDGYQKPSSPPSMEGGENPVDDTSRVLVTVKQKLELMTSMLEKSNGNMLPEVQSKLEDEMKGLLEEVSKVTKSTAAKME